MGVGEMALTHRIQGIEQQTILTLNRKQLEKQRVELSLVQRPSYPDFCPLVCVQYNTQRQNSVKNGKGLRTPVPWMTSGGHEVDVGGGGWCPTTNSFTVNHWVSFLLVKLSTVYLVNIWGPGYRWNARWLSLVRYLNVDPSPPTFTSRSPDVIHVTGVPRPSPFSCALLPSSIILNANQRTKKG